MPGGIRRTGSRRSCRLRGHRPDARSSSSQHSHECAATVDCDARGHLSGGSRPSSMRSRGGSGRAMQRKSRRRRRGQVARSESGTRRGHAQRHTMRLITSSPSRGLAIDPGCWFGTGAADAFDLSRSRRRRSPNPDGDVSEQERPATPDRRAQPPALAGRHAASGAMRAPGDPVPGSLASGSRRLVLDLQPEPVERLPVVVRHGQGRELLVDPAEGLGVARRARPAVPMSASRSSISCDSSADVS